MSKGLSSVPLLKANRAFVLAGIIGMVSFLVWRAPAIEEQWEHYMCLRRHSADSERHKNAVAVLGTSAIPRSRVREFLNASYPELSIHDDEAGIRAGTLVFESDGVSNTVSYVPQPIPCPVA
jgi:hypothetical protein